MSDQYIKKIYNEELAASPYSVIDPTIYVIDDDAEMRRSLHALLSTTGIISWPFASATDFLTSIKSLKPAPILLDIRMPDVDGIELLDLLFERDLGWPIIVMTGHSETPLAVQALKLGAIDFLEKPFTFDALHTAMQVAFKKMTHLITVNTVRTEARRRFGLLTLRETDVIKVLMQGMSNKVAAHELSLSSRTVEMHRGNALLKLNVRSLAEVVRLGNESELDFIGPKKGDDNAIV